MKNKGFTIVELIAVIVILAIIILLAVSGYRGVSTKVKEKSYDNLIYYIETKASEYANETGNLITNVDTLVKLGFIEADDEEGNVKNPINGDILNCHIVSITKEENTLYGQYSKEEECKVENLVLTNLDMWLNVYSTTDNVTLGEKIESNTWSNKNVILEAYLGEKIKAEEVKTIIWSSNAGQEKVEVTGNFYNQNKYLVTAEQIINTTYEATIVLNDGTSYHSQATIKIDKQRPIIHNVNIENENNYTTHNKKIKITASDGNGSGIYGYYVGKNSNCLAVKYESYKSGTYESNKEAGIYYVCVKDIAGNVSEDISTRKVEIKYVDNKPPVCVFSGESTNWTSGERTISLSCEDKESGCVQGNSIQKTYKDNMKTDYWEYTIRDLAGNETVCKKNVNVYIDKDSPICVFSGESTSWTANNRTISVSCKDSLSGCATNPLQKTYTSNIKTDYLTYTIRDNAGNETICSKSLNIYVNKEKPVITIKENPKTLGQGDYDFRENVEVNWRGLGEGKLSCNPESSRKSGIYTVTCTVTGNNGLSVNTSFEVKHNYKARLVVCETRTQCYGEHYPCNGEMCPCMQGDGSCPCGYINTNPGTTCCDDERKVEVCVYDCPKGGILNKTDKVCYFR